LIDSYIASIQLASCVCSAVARRTEYAPSDVHSSLQNISHSALQTVMMQHRLMAARTSSHTGCKNFQWKNSNVGISLKCLAIITPFIRQNWQNKHAVCMHIKWKGKQVIVDILVDSETAGLTDYTLLFDEYLLINVNCCEGDGILNASTQRRQLLSVWHAVKHVVSANTQHRTLLFCAVRPIYTHWLFCS